MDRGKQRAGEQGEFFVRQIGAQARQGQADQTKKTGKLFLDQCGTG